MPRLRAKLSAALQRRVLRLAERVLARAGFGTNASGNNSSSR